MPDSGLLERLKPFIGLALAVLAACLAGLAISARAHTRAPEKAGYFPALSAPVSDDWNLPKQI